MYHTTYPTEGMKLIPKIKCVLRCAEAKIRSLGIFACPSHFAPFPSCNPTYLYRFGINKKEIKKRFDESEHFFVSYPADMECSELNCRLRNTNCHKQVFEHSEEFNLKQFYDTCSEEKTVSPYPFVADLLLTNSKNENVEPVLIEICVSHPCEEEKRNSGLRIIEVKIGNEADLESAFENGVLKEVHSYTDRKKRVEFISFKRKFCRKTTAKIFRYIIDNFTPSGYFEQIPCTRSNYKVRKDSDMELNVVWNVRMDNIPDCKLSIWLYRNKGYRRCSACKYSSFSMYRNRLSCNYNAKYGKNPYPKMTDAENCRIFSVKNRIGLDGFYIEEVKAIDMNAKPEYKVIVADSSYVCEDYNYFKEQCLKYLSEKIKSHEVILVSGTANDIEHMTEDFALEYNLQIQPHKAKWDKHDNEDNAAFESNEQMVAYSDAMIVFWNGRSRRMRHLIDAARKKGIRVVEPKCI